MPPISFLLAFGFGNLAMLGWLGAAAAPLLIHLWSRQQYREAPWAAMQFLLAAMRKKLAEASTAAVAVDRDSHVDHHLGRARRSSPMAINFWPGIARPQVSRSW